MTDTQKATPRPWRLGAVGRSAIVLDANGEPVYLRGNAFEPPLAAIVDASARRNLNDILTAVNAYDAMREALHAVRAQAERAHADGCSQLVSEGADICDCWLARVDAALAAAEGKGEAR